MKLLFKDAWTIAIQSLGLVEARKVNERLALAQTTKSLGSVSADASKLAHQLVYETIRRRNLIDKLIDRVLKPKSLINFNVDLRAFLRLYVYQTRFADASGKVNVEDASRVASIARSILGWKTVRQVEPYLGFLLTCEMGLISKAGSEEGEVGLRTFHPTWFVKYCFRLFGREEAVAFLEGNAHPPPTFIRLNTLKASEGEILEKLEAEGFILQKDPLLKNVYQVMGTKQPSSNSAGYKQGLFYIQDKASCFAAEASDPRAGAIVLDVCAAPGAKTTYIAQLMQNKGVILSIDYSIRRMSVWQADVARMGATIAGAAIADACVSLPFSGVADLVVLDPPCTSSGVFGRLPSAKWRLSPHSIDRMAGIQWRMIESCAEIVKSGGFLVYATCSITEEENELIIERFLQNHFDFALVDIIPAVGLPGLRGLSKCRRLYPHLHQSNGFFIAKLVKK